MNLCVKPVSDKRLFSGLVQMRIDKPGTTELHNEHWVGWYLSGDEAKGNWISQTTSWERYTGAVIAYVSAYDITDAAAGGFVPA